MRSRVVAGLVAAAILIAATDAHGASPPRKPALRAFGSCASLLTYARANASRTGGMTGVPTRASAADPQVLTTPPIVDGTRPQPKPVRVAPGDRAESAPDFSSTNVQEVGVDEPDIVKTDGARLWAVSDGRLRAVDVAGDEPRLLGSVELEGSGHQLFIRGDRALILATVSPTRAGQEGPRAETLPPLPPESSVRLTEIDLSDPARMSVQRTLTLEGRLVDARLTDGTARVVVTSTPPPIAEDRVARTRLGTFVPRTTLRSRISGRTFRRSLVPCGDVRRPSRFSGLDLLTVLTIDLDRGLFSVDRDAIMAGAQTVYASPTGLYFASQRYSPALENGRSVPEAMRTEIHRFDASRPGETSYRSSGFVPGFVLDQYGLSEYAGVLRVASTEEPPWSGAAEGERDESESFVTVLEERGSALTEVGRERGLGRGERIYAVRFVGETGYVVTYRQVDPLYTLDLSEPTAPKVVGELKILGYSAYLHPVGDDRLLGIGQDATVAGRTKGAQVSLFDVSDLRAPKRVAQAAIGASSSSTAEFDPHAFLFWEPASLAVVPIERYEPLFTGAIGFRTGRTELVPAGTVEHPARSDGSRPPIARSLVIGDKLYTLSYAGLATNRLDTLAPVGMMVFP